MHNFFCNYYGSYNSILYYQAKVLLLAFGYSRKKTNSGDWGHGISRGIEERKYGNSRSQLKKLGNFQGCSSKNSCRISMGLGFWPWNFQRYYTNLMNLQGWKLVFCGFQKIISLTSRPCFFSGIVHFLSGIPYQLRRSFGNCNIYISIIGL